MTDTDTTVTFPVRRVLVEELPDLPSPLLNTSRPLFGTEVECELRGFTVVMPEDVRLQEENRRLDAHLVEWVTHEQAIAETRARYEASAYDLTDVSDDDLLSGWKMHRTTR